MTSIVDFDHFVLALGGGPLRQLREYITVSAVTQTFWLLIGREEDRELVLDAANIKAATIEGGTKPGFVVLLDRKRLGLINELDAPEDHYLFVDVLTPGDKHAGQIRVCSASGAIVSTEHGELEVLNRLAGEIRKGELFLLSGDDSQGPQKVMRAVADADRETGKIFIESTTAGWTEQDYRAERREKTHIQDGPNCILQVIFDPKPLLAKLGLADTRN